MEKVLSNHTSSLRTFSFEEPYIKKALEAAAERINRFNSSLGLDPIGPYDVAREVVATWASEQLASSDLTDFGARLVRESSLRIDQRDEA